MRGELWKGRAVDGKLKSSLEWPNSSCRGDLSGIPSFGPYASASTVQYLSYTSLSSRHSLPFLALWMPTLHQ